MKKIILIFFASMLMSGLTAFTYANKCKKENELEAHLKDIEIITKNDFRKLLEFESNDLYENIEKDQSEKYTAIRTKLDTLPKAEQKLYIDKLVYSFKRMVMDELNSNYANLNSQFQELFADQFECDDFVVINDLVAIFGIKKFSDFLSSMRTKGEIKENDSMLYSKNSLSDFRSFSQSEKGLKYWNIMNEASSRKLLTNYFETYKKIALDRAIEKTFSNY